MKILFICGCMEPGKDGVGDYVQILSKELVLRHKEVAILAINDLYLSEDKEVIRDDIEVLRLTAQSTWKSRINKLEHWINKVKPHRISWQFVLYAYHPKGFPFLPVYLITRSLKEYRNVSIMFHELWIGAAREDSFTNKITGKIQKLIISLMLQNLNPDQVFTSNFTYSRLLQKLRIDSIVLPLFSNIPFVPGGREFFTDFLQQKDINIPKDFVKIGHFGRIPFIWQRQRFFEELRKIKAPVVFFIAGRSDQMTPVAFEKELKLQMPFLQVINIGEQPAQMISGFLQYIDLGLTLNAPQLLDKSGVFAAFREHGLPAVIAGVDKNYLKETSLNDHQDPLKIELDDFAQMVKKVKRSLPNNTRKEISKEFLQVLQGREKREKSTILFEI